MSILRRKINENSRSAIIVSHNIQQSVKYADTIILITKEDTDPLCGHVNNQNIFTKSNEKWFNSFGEEMQNITLKIQQLLQ
jgi:ABC-type enterochelin transport system ATPase subunit